MLRHRTEGEQERFYCSYAPHYPVRVASGPALFSQLSAGLRLRRHVERLMRPHLFRDQHELLEYAEEHDLLYAWEGMRSFSRRLRTLAPGQYEIVAVQTKRGITRALLFPKGIFRAEQEARAPSGEPQRTNASDSD
jgi:hypothetical protein